MAFWNEPLEAGRLWRGPQLGHPFVRGLGAIFGRVAVIATALLVACSFVGALGFVAKILVLEWDKVMRGGAILIPILAYLLLWASTSYRRQPNGDDDGPAGDKAHSPVPARPSPKGRVGTEALALPKDYDNGRP